MKTFLDFRKLVMGESSKKAEDRLLVLKEEIMEVVYLRMMGFNKSSLLIRQLHQLQKDCIHLSDVVYKAQLAQKSCKFYSLAQQCLIEILESLRSYKNKYFNLHQDVPLYLLQEVRPQLTEKKLLVEAVMKKLKFDPALQVILLAPFLKFRSYQQMEYLLRYADEWIAIQSEEALIDLLLNKGFNTNAFVQYYRLKIADKVNASYQTVGHLDVLHGFLRELSMMPKKPFRCYDSLGPDIRETLLKFVEAEIRDKNRKHDLHHTKIDHTLINTESYRMKTSLSVDGVAYLFRLLVDNEAIDANPRTDLMAFLASHIQTCGKQGMVSSQSLYSKYRQVTQATAINIRTLLAKMTKQIDADFGR
jgi:hypothetical protein